MAFQVHGPKFIGGSYLEKRIVVLVHFFGSTKF